MPFVGQNTQPLLLELQYLIVQEIGQMIVFAHLALPQTGVKYPVATMKGLH